MRQSSHAIRNGSSTCLLPVSSPQKKHKETTSDQISRPALRGTFPGGPVVRSSPSNVGDVGSIPGRGTKILHALGQLSSRATVETHSSQKQKKEDWALGLHSWFSSVAALCDVTPFYGQEIEAEKLSSVLSVTHAASKQHHQNLAPAT